MACHNSGVALGRSSFFDEAYFSYETCGSIDSWTAYQTEDALRGLTLRASMPATWHPFAFGYDANGTLLPDWTNGIEIVGERTGMIAEFIQRLAESAGFEIEWMDLTTASRD